MTSSKEISSAKTAVYHGDSIKVTIKGYVPSPRRISFGTDVKGLYFNELSTISGGNWQVKYFQPKLVTLRITSCLKFIVACINPLQNCHIVANVKQNYVKLNVLNKFI